MIDQIENAFAYLMSGFLIVVSLLCLLLRYNNPSDVAKMVLAISSIFSFSLSMLLLIFEIIELA